MTPRFARLVIVRMGDAEQIGKGMGGHGVRHADSLLQLATAEGRLITWLPFACEPLRFGDLRGCHFLSQLISVPRRAFT
jgi:hypothetical protein